MSARVEYDAESEFPDACQTDTGDYECPVCGAEFRSPGTFSPHVLDSHRPLDIWLSVVTGTVRVGPEALDETGV